MCFLSIAAGEECQHSTVNANKEAQCYQLSCDSRSCGWQHVDMRFGKEDGMTSVANFVFTKVLTAARSLLQVMSKHHVVLMIIGTP
jgi:hypothetical protein